MPFIIAALLTAMSASLDMSSAPNPSSIKQKTLPIKAIDDPRLHNTPTRDLTKELRKLEEEFVDIYERAYTGITDSNQDGKNFHKFTPNDIAEKLSIGTLDIIRQLFYDEQYDLIDRIKPTDMSRAQFSHVILYNLAQRGQILKHYFPFFASNVNVTVRRPNGLPTADQRLITISPKNVILYDASVAALTNPRLGAIVIPEDVKRQTGLALGRPIGMDMRSDTSSYDLGYTAGISFTADSLMYIGVVMDKPLPEIQPAYCAGVANIYAAEGRDIDTTQAFTMGFMQARIDKKSGFRDVEAGVGVDGPCPETPALLTAEARRAGLKLGSVTVSVRH